MRVFYFKLYCTFYIKYKNIVMLNDRITTQSTRLF